MTGLVVGHAIFGERRRGHDLLGASPAAGDVRDVVARMDLRGSPPPHTPWRAYFSGFPDGARYVLARTAPDPAAPRQMVFSRALLVPLALIVERDDLSGMLALLEELGDDRGEPTDIAWQTGGGAEPDVALSAALVERGTGPVVWPSEDGFGQAVAGLWSRLWPAARAKLSFRLAFSPQDVASDTPDLVCTPGSMVGRWSGYRIARVERPAPEGAAVEFLLGGTASRDLRGRVVDLSSAGVGVAALARLVEVAAVARDGGGLPELLDAMRMAEHLAPSPDAGAAAKEELVGKAAAAVAAATAAEVRMARNLDLSAFRDPAPFLAALSKWAAGALWDEQDPESLAAVLMDTWGDGPVRAWREAVAAGVRRATSRPGERVARGVWRALLREPRLLGRVAADRAVGGLDEALSAAAPREVDRKVGALLAGGAAELRMPLLNAATFAASLPPPEAIDAHLSCSVQADSVSLALAAARASPSELIAASLRHDQPDLLVAAADAAAGEPALLRGLDPADRRWRALWTATLSKTSDAWRGPANPAAAVTGLLDAALAGKGDADLLGEIGRTPLANVLTYPRRAELWPVLPPAARPAYLSETADAWSEALATGREPGTPEPELADAICAPSRLRPLLERIVSVPSAGCDLFRALPRLSEWEFTAWLERVMQAPPLGQDDAVAIGRLVGARRWSDAAAAIGRAIGDRGRTDLRPALDHMKDLLGWIRQWDLGVFGETPGADARWGILEEVAVELYGIGPGQDGLWTRAGGKEADIPIAPTGREGWRLALDGARKGKGRVDVQRLIGVMREDHPHNAALGRMAWDSLFKARR